MTFAALAAACTGLAVASLSRFLAWTTSSPLVRFDPGSAVWHCVVRLAAAFEGTGAAIWRIPVDVVAVAWFAGAIALVKGIGHSGRPLRFGVRAGYHWSYLLLWAAPGAATACVLLATAVRPPRYPSPAAVLGAAMVFVLFAIAASRDAPAFWCASSESGVDYRAALRRWRMSASVAVVLLWTAIDGVYGPVRGASIEPAPLDQVTEFEFLVWYAAQPRIDSGMRTDGARVAILKVNDFLCPPCGRTDREYAPVLERLELEEPGAVVLRPVSSVTYVQPWSCGLGSSVELIA